MSSAANPLNGTTNGNVATGNPQNIGSQSLSAPQSNLQSPSANLFSGSSLRLTDANGQPLNLSSTSQTVTSPTKPTNHRALITIGTSGLVIIIVVVITWLSTRRSSH